MKNKNRSSNGNLRRQAEAKLSGSIDKEITESMKDADTLRLLHELQVHQIELEMQNEQLIQAQADVKAGLKHYTDLYNELYDFAPVGYFTLSRDGTIQRANLTAAHLLGMERSKLIKLHFDTLVSVEFRPYFKDFMERVFANRAKETYEAALIKNGHEQFWVHLEATIEDEQGEECRIVIVDITERKQVEDGLRESEEKWRSLVSATPDYIGVHDQEGRFLFLNHYDEGFAEKDVIGSSLFQYLSPEATDAFRSNMEKALNTWTTQHFEYTALRDQGTAKIYEEYLVPMRGKDQEINFLVVSRDITERRQTEIEIQQRKEQLELINILQTERLHKLYEGDIERTEKRRIQLALDLHDVVLNQLAILRLSIDDSQVSQSFQGAYDEVTRHLREIVTDLRPPMLSYGLKPAIEGLADNMIDRNKDVAIDLQIDGEARYAENIEQHLFRIVQEACENALRHSHATQVKVSAKLMSESVWLSIEDNGNGFQPDKPIELDDLLVNKHFGLAGMVERATLIGAEVEINSIPQEGTQIQIKWNVRKNR